MGDPRRIWNLLFANVGERRFPPFLESAVYQSRSNSGVLNANATFQNPFNPAPAPYSAYPVWLPYSSSTSLSMTIVDPHFRAPSADQYSLNVQYALTPSTLLQVGYVGTRGQHLQVTQSFNEPYLASPTDPVNGITTNTIQNAAQRVPYIGFAPSGTQQLDGRRGFEIQRAADHVGEKLRRGLQVQASYTYSKALTDVTGNGTFPNGGSLLNDNRNVGQDWGPPVSTRGTGS